MLLMTPASPQTHMPEAFCMHDKIHDAVSLDLHLGFLIEPGSVLHAEARALCFLPCFK